MRIIASKEYAVHLVRKYRILVSADDEDEAEERVLEDPTMDGWETIDTDVTFVGATGR